MTAGPGPIPPKGWQVTVQAEWLEKLADRLEESGKFILGAAKEIRKTLKAQGKGYKG